MRDVGKAALANSSSKLGPRGTEFSSESILKPTMNGFICGSLHWPVHVNFKLKVE